MHTCTSLYVQGRLTLLLGPPSSGKSTFLKVLAGRYQVGGAGGEWCRGGRGQGGGSHRERWGSV
jgi:ABC-type multidrug transport system ATPase subunit